LPYRNPRVCSQPGCGALILKGYYCTKHKTLSDIRYRPAQYNHAKLRNNKAWQDIRKEVLEYNPYCECGNIATEVDHIVAIRNGGDNDPSNLQAMCKSCHSRKTLSEVMNKKF